MWGPTPNPSQEGNVGRVGRAEKVGGIIVPVSFCAYLPFILTFWSLKLKSWHFFSLQKGTYFYMSVFLDLISKP
ncbi:MULTISPECIES: hypothetical protein [unclassified Okeania]|uniref:hypothetical protein n=1 Tax=unclassified Okeania TaxID=2634635 RepID=UPI000FAE2E10|nr:MULTISPECIES: hypothetical protein [unclassified Okeania]NET18904.1 hypothetical protein [Okeania sp. SIO1H5]NET93387.1 hypothetical protein [Okeania sp. SIO1H2]RQH15324.1 hypothetical protein D4Z78_22130 [Okeania hirsuta]